MDGRGMKHKPQWIANGRRGAINAEAAMFNDISKAAWYAAYRDMLAQMLGIDWCDLTLEDIQEDVQRRLEAMAHAGIYPAATVA